MEVAAKNQLEVAVRWWHGSSVKWKWLKKINQRWQQQW